MRSFLILLAGGTLLSACGSRPGGGTITETRSGSAAVDSVAPAPPSADLAELARRVVTTTIGVGAGDVVIVDGGKHTIPLMELMAIEAAKAGGMPNLWLESDRVLRAFLTEVPAAYLDQKPSYLSDWYGHTTVWIGLGAFENPKAIFADIPEAKLAKLSAAGQEVFGMLNASPIRGAIIEYPTAAAAEEAGLPLDRFAAIQWAAIGADYGRIAAAAEALKAKLQNAKEVRITTAGGTDLRFALAKRPIVVSAGVVRRGPVKEKLLLNRFASLPGGTVSVAPLESSVSGALVVPRDRCKFGPLKDTHYRFSGGTLAEAKAAAGDACLQENLRTYGAPMHRLGGFTIGLNPELRVVEDPGDYRPSAAAGQVTLTLGDNQFLGGTNVVPGGVSVGIPITGATVTLDGETVIEEGRLVGPLASALR